MLFKFMFIDANMEISSDCLWSLQITMKHRIDDIIQCFKIVSRNTTTEYEGIKIE